MDFATLDHDREARQGHPEIVYGPGKSPAQAAKIAREIFRRSRRVLVTRVTLPQARAIRKAVPGAKHDAIARTVCAIPRGARGREGILIVSAGTSDQATAREALETCRFLGERPDLMTDVGVAGIHRLLARVDRLRKARVVIAVAGMEGALASVVGGLVRAPVIGLPTSVGYGTGAGGLAALLAMLNSCAANVCCVNIDDGVGAAIVASAIQGPMR